MKHNLKITLILLVMFIITQLIGLAVINAYSPQTKLILNETTQQYENVTTGQTLPYGIQPPENLNPNTSLTVIIISMIFAVVIILILTKIRAALFLRIWFLLVVILAIGLTLSTLFFKIPNGSYIALIIAIPLAFIKVFRQNFLVHNLTELIIYPGIAAVFVPILSVPTVIALLVLISFYDIYAVWHAGFMQKLAKFQINELKFFAGFFIPYASKKVKMQIAKLKKSGKSLKNKKIKINLAILGGGDVVFPIIMSGVVLTSKGFGLIPALFVVLGASLALLYLFIFAKKGKPYPAMPFIASGALFGFSLGWLLTLLL